MGTNKTGLTEQNHLFLNLLPNTCTRIASTTHLTTLPNSKVMTRTALLAISFFVLGSTSAFAPVVVGTAKSTSNDRAKTAFLVPEQGRQLVAFSQDYLSKKARESAGKASNLSSPRRGGPFAQDGLGVASAAKSFVTRLLGHDDAGARRIGGRSLEEELMNAYPKDTVCHTEDEVLFHQIVD